MKNILIIIILLQMLTSCNWVEDNIIKIYTISIANIMDCKKGNNELKYVCQDSIVLFAETLDLSEKDKSELKEYTNFNRLIKIFDNSVDRSELERVLKKSLDGYVEINKKDKTFIPPKDPFGKKSYLYVSDLYKLDNKDTVVIKISRIITGKHIINRLLLFEFKDNIPELAHEFYSRNPF